MTTEFLSLNDSIQFERVLKSLSSLNLLLIVMKIMIYILRFLRRVLSSFKQIKYRYMSE